MTTIIVDPATAVRVDVSDHIVDVALREIIAKVLQYPPINQHTASHTHYR